MQEFLLTQGMNVSVNIEQMIKVQKMVQIFTSKTVYEEKMNHDPVTLSEWEETMLVVGDFDAIIASET